MDKEKVIKIIDKRIDRIEYMMNSTIHVENIVKFFQDELLILKKIIEEEWDKK